MSFCWFTAALVSSHVFAVLACCQSSDGRQWTYRLSMRRKHEQVLSQRYHSSRNLRLMSASHVSNRVCLNLLMLNLLHLKSLLQASRWSYNSDVAISHDKKTRANVLQRYHFSSNLRRMSVIIGLEEEDSVQPASVALLKGAPEVIRQHCKHVSSHSLCLRVRNFLSWPCSRVHKCMM